MKVDEVFRLYLDMKFKDPLLKKNNAYTAREMSKEAVVERFFYCWLLICSLICLNLTCIPQQSLSSASTSVNSDMEPSFIWQAGKVLTTGLTGTDALLLSDHLCAGDTSETCKGSVDSDKTCHFCFRTYW